MNATNPATRPDPMPTAVCLVCGEEWSVDLMWNECLCCVCNAADIRTREEFEAWKDLSPDAWTAYRLNRMGRRGEDA